MESAGKQGMLVPQLIYLAPAWAAGLLAVCALAAMQCSFFGIGPGAVIGNTIFGSPNDATSEVFGMPSIRVWRILWWALGVFMMWFLAYKMEMSTVPRKEVEALRGDIADEPRPVA